MQNQETALTLLHRGVESTRKHSAHFCYEIVPAENDFCLGQASAERALSLGSTEGGSIICDPLAQTAPALDTDHPVMQCKSPATEICPTDSPKSKAGLQGPAHTGGFCWHQQPWDMFASAMGLRYVTQWQISHSSSHMWHSPAIAREQVLSAVSRMLSRQYHNVKKCKSLSLLIKTHL